MQSSLETRVFTLAISLHVTLALYKLLLLTYLLIKILFQQVNRRSSSDIVTLSVISLISKLIHLNRQLFGERFGVVANRLSVPRATYRPYEDDIDNHRAHCNSKVVFCLSAAAAKRILSH